MKDDFDPEWIKPEAFEEEHFWNSVEIPDDYDPWDEEFNCWESEFEEEEEEEEEFDEDEFDEDEFDEDE